MFIEKTVLFTYVMQVLSRVKPKMPYVKKAVHLNPIAVPFASNQRSLDV
jgi:hypothetical protein